MVVTDIKLYLITKYLGIWTKGGYITLVKNSTKAAERIYTISKKSVLVPAMNKNGDAKTRKGKKVIKDLQSAQERAEIRFTHAHVKKQKTETKKVNIDGLKLTSIMLKGKKADYSPTTFYIDAIGNIVCKDTGFAVDKLKLQTGDSYGFTCPKKSA
jgi:hypothetical protein